MPAPRKYDQETRDRAVSMYQERRQTHPGECESAIQSRRQIGALIDVNSETLRGWIERTEIDAGVRPGTTREEHTELVRLRREVGELRRANEILRTSA
jgi:transposase-like protein